jgi:tetratricopeptide (TPR) repeat protein
MKRKILLTVFICCGFFNLLGDELEDIYNQAMNASRNGQNERALDLLWQCLDFTKEDPVATVHILADSADIMAEMGNGAEALKIYNKCLEFYHAQEMPAYLVATLNNMALLFKKSGEYAKAVEYFESALSYSVENGLKVMQMRILSNMVSVYAVLGEFERAQKCGEDALSIAESKNDQTEIGSIHNNLGDIYISLGNYESAISHLSLALEVLTHTDDKEAVPTIHMNLAVVYNYMGMYNRSLEEYIKAMKLIKGNPNKYFSEFLNCANGIASVFVQKGLYERALPFYNEALSLSRQRGNTALTAEILGNMGTCYEYLKKYDQAFQCYEESSELHEEMGDLPGIATAETRFGTNYHNREEYELSIEHLEKAVELYERLRKSAEGSLKRDYLAKSVTAYRWLISAYTRLEDGDAAFAAAEMISARLLREQLDQDRAETLRDFSINKEKLAFLGEDRLVVNFANVDFSGAICRLSASTEGVFAEEYSIQHVVDKLNRKMGKTIRSFLYYTGSMEEHEITDSLDLEELVEYYRLLITSPFRTAEEEVNIDLLSRVFYDILLGDLDLAEIEHLLMIPGGILALLPFEALKDEEGRYLIEEHEVSYIPSLSVLDSLNNRPYRNSRKRDLLAMGGAVYQREGFSESQVQSDRLNLGF